MKASCAVLLMEVLVLVVMVVLVVGYCWLAL